MNNVPMLWIAFSEGGPIRCWVKDEITARKYADDQGLTFQKYVLAPAAWMTPWNQELPDLGDVYATAEKVRANGGDWYNEDQMASILSQCVGDPAKSEDAKFIAMASPRFALGMVECASDLMVENASLVCENKILRDELDALKGKAP